MRRDIGNSKLFKYSKITEFRVQIKRQCYLGGRRGQPSDAPQKIAFACEDDFLRLWRCKLPEIFLEKSKAKFPDAIGIWKFDEVCGLRPELRLKQCKTVKKPYCCMNN